MSSDSSISFRAFADKSYRIDLKFDEFNHYGLLHTFHGKSILSTSFAQGNPGRLSWCQIGIDRDEIQSCLLVHTKISSGETYEGIDLNIDILVWLCNTPGDTEYTEQINHMKVEKSKTL